MCTGYTIKGTSRSQKKPCPVSVEGKLLTGKKVPRRCFSIFEKYPSSLSTVQGCPITQYMAGGPLIVPKRSMLIRSSASAPHLSGQALQLDSVLCSCALGGYR